MRSKQGRVVMAAALVGAVIALAACGGGGKKKAEADKLDLSMLSISDSSADEMRKLYDAATKGNQSLTVYGASTEKYAPVFKKFGDRFPGIKVNSAPLTGAELESKLSQEFSSDKHVGDVLENTTLNYQSKGYYETYKPVTAPSDLDKKFITGGEQMWAPTGYYFGIEYNTDKVSASDAPKAWKDLADPKWKGKIASGDPSQPSATSDTLIKLQAAGVIDDAYLAALKSNQLAVKGSLELADQAVVRGEYSILLTTPRTFFNATKKKGAPVALVVPTEGTIYLPDFFGILKGSKNPDAAKLFMNWLFTKEAQEELAKVGTVPHLPGIKTTDGVTIAEIKQLDVPDEAKMKDLWGPGTKKLKDILGGAAAK